MGAELWHHAAPWRIDPEDALFELQVRFLAETYDLPTLVQEHLESAREAVGTIEAEGDGFGLLDMYRNELEMLEEAASEPLTEDPRQRIELIREIYENSGQGIGNILDVTGISDRRDPLVAERLTDDEMVRLIGATRPTIVQARQAVGKVNEELDRGECACFPFYEANEFRRPAGWYFIGNTID
jgi:hypothetical protein